MFLPVKSSYKQQSVSEGLSTMSFTDLKAIAKARQELGCVCKVERIGVRKGGRKDHHKQEGLHAEEGCSTNERLARGSWNFRSTSALVDAARTVLNGMIQLLSFLSLVLADSVFAGHSCGTIHHMQSIAIFVVLFASK